MLALAVAAAMLLLLAAVALAAGAFTDGDEGASKPAAGPTTAAPAAEVPTTEPTGTVAGAPGATAAAADGARVNRFSGTRAFALARLQVEVGQRPAGSPQLRALARRLVTRLPRGRLEPVRAHPGLSNVVGSIPGREPAILIGAHYDTEATPKGFVGANDSAAGTAVLLELARVLRRAPRPAGSRAIRFALFDGEEEPRPTENFYRDALRGSKAYVREHRGAISRMILLDYVGNKGLRLPREGSSDKALWGRLRAAARRAGVAELFPPLDGVTLLDDHTPFLRAGVPAIDLIDFDYAHKDTLRDTLDKLSVRSLDAVGEAVAELVLAERRR